jgi:beta-lactam-binding protein with PASTA domain
MTRIVLVLLTIAALFASAVGMATAQVTEPSGQVNVINGASTDPVVVTAGGTEIANGLTYGEDAVAATLASGNYEVVFAGGSVDSSAPITVGPVTAQTVVSGFGPDSAQAYGVDTAPIEAGMAKVTVWNATEAIVDATVDGLAPEEIAPGGGLPTMVVAAGTTVEIVIDGVARDVTAGADSYTDVFAVDDTVDLKIAVAVIASMTDLIAGLSPTPPDTTVPPPLLVTIPDTAGETAADATTQLEDAGFVVTESFEQSDTVDEGLVIRTQPAAGNEVPEGSIVDIVISAGGELVIVPDVTGQPASDAEVTIQDAGLRISTQPESSIEVDPGLVIATEPPADTEVEAGTTVTMFISTGPARVVIPDVTGETQEEATLILEDLGLVVATVEDASNEVEDGLVITTTPLAGTEVDEGSTVTMTVSTGREDPGPNAASVATAISSSGILTVSGINFLPDSVAESVIIGTNISASETVDANGLWQSELDMSSLPGGTVYQLLVTGTDAEGNAFEDVQTVPSIPSEDSGVPLWVWIVGGLLLLAIVGVIIWLVQRNEDDAAAADGADSPSGTTGA